MSSDRFERRRERALRAASDAGLSGLLATPGADLAYLTGYDAIALERLTLLVLRTEGAPALIVPALERPAAEAAPGTAGIDIASWADGTDPYEVASGMLEDGRYAIADATRAAQLLELQSSAAGAMFVATSSVLPLLRAVKDAEEIETLRRAARGADAAFDDVIRLAFGGRREVEVAEDLHRLLREHGHRRVEFTIVASGPNGASPHHGTGDRAISAGDAVVMDFGGVAGGYYSDITRTVFVGEPSAEQRRVHGVVREAQQAAFEAVRPGVAAEDVDRAARAVIAEAGYGEAFIHRTGHGIGIEVHEPPYIVAGDTTPLEPGMTFSDEPGIYLAGRFGVRIEDQLVVTERGAERLNEASREPVVVA